MPSYDETPYTAPGAPSTWRRRGLVDVALIAQAVDETILRAVFQNFAKLYEKKVLDFKIALGAWATAWAAGKLLAKELFKSVVEKLQALLNFLRERKFQEKLKASIRAGYLKTARELWEATLPQNKKVRGRKTQRVRTRIPDTGKKSETRGPQLQAGRMVAPRQSDEGTEDLDEGLGFFLGKGKKK